jgi:hypothetical protein
VRANPEHDGIVREFGTGQIGTVLFWFRQDDAAPFLVAKVLGASLSVEAVRQCAALHDRANALIGYALFPRLYDVADHGGRTVVFMEPLDGPNFDIELARAVAGPERSSHAVRRVVSRQLADLGRALRDLRQVRLSETTVTWGAQAQAYAEDFFSLCPAARGLFGNGRLERMRALIESMPLDVHLVLTEDHLANYLPGPRAVDQLVEGLPELCRRWPGPVDGLRILMAVFRASALREAFRSYRWIDALAACVLDGEKDDVIGKPVRGFLADIGLGSARADLVWAFMLGVFFLRGWQELSFHAGNAPLAQKLRGDYLGYARRMAALFDATSARGRLRLEVPALDTTALDSDFADREAPLFMSPQRVFTEARTASTPPLVQLIRTALDPYPGLRRAARSAYHLLRRAGHLGER